MTVIGTVLRTRSVEYMPLPLSAMTLLCSSSWLWYSVLVVDTFIMVPNGIGVILGILQVLCWGGVYYFCDGSNFDEDGVNEVNVLDKSESDKSVLLGGRQV